MGHPGAFEIISLKRLLKPLAYVYQFENSELLISVRMFKYQMQGIVIPHTFFNIKKPNQNKD